MRSQNARFLLRSGLTVLGLLALYAVIPVPGQREPLWFTVVMALAGLAALAYAFITLAQRARNQSEGQAIRVEALVAVLYCFIVFTSLIYLGVASDAGQFTGLSTRVDALYFTMSTIATVGFGDVHATGQVARVLVTIQMFLDIIFVGLVARIILPSVVNNRARARAAQDDGTDTGDDDLAAPGGLG